MTEKSTLASLDVPIWLFGAGHMGLALLKGWRAAGLVSEAAPAIVVERYVSDDLQTLIDAGIARLQEDGAGLGAEERCLVLAIKPQSLDEAAPRIAEILSGGGTLISILAGKTVASLAAAAGWGDKHEGIVRVMPNLPAAIGRGASGGYSPSADGSVHKMRAEPLLKAAGAFYWLDEETQIDSVTAVSGSGPAYLFYLIEALESAAQKIGLAPDVAAGLARQTIVGAAAMLDGRNADTPSSLRAAVTSPGGTTHAALQILTRDEGLKALMAEAVEAAEARAKELGAGGGDN